jgi:putative ABC transport system permease protein
MNTMLYAVIAVSVINIFVTGWLVHYMNKFMLQRRSKEFGTYMTLGISNKAIAKLFLMENMIMGAVSFVIGVAAGSMLYQILTMIIMHIFEATYQVKLTFSVKALGLTFLYVCLIYAFSILRSRFILKKMKVYDLLYAEKKNETMKLKSNKGNWLIFIASLVFGILGTKILWETFSDGENVTSERIWTVFLCFVLCIYSFYLSLSSILVKIFINNNRLKYKNDNLFLFRNLSAKMNTMSITLGTLGFLLTLTLTSVSVGMLFKGFFDEQVKSVLPFDITVSSPEASDDFSPYKNYIHENLTVEEEYIYPVYESGTKKIYDLISDTALGGSYFEDDTVMKFSDYQRLRKMLGYDEVVLKKGHFLLHCMSGVKKEADTEKDLTVTIDRTTLKYQESHTEAFALEGTNGAYYVLVVPDEAAKNLKLRNMIYAVNTLEETTAADYEELCKYIQPTRSGDTIYILLGNVEVKGAMLAENRSVYTIMSFSLFYIGLIFICVAATILAVQLLSDSMRFKFLDHLGMQGSRIDSLILKQFFIYFGLPILLPIPFSILVTTSIYQLLKVYVEASILSMSLMISLGLFLFVYVLYFIATYISYRKNVFQ